MSEIQYSPACFQCRKEAGKELAGVTPDELCFDHVKQQRDELLAAGENAERWMTEHGCSHEYPVLRDLRTTIAKIRGES